MKKVINVWVISIIVCIVSLIILISPEDFKDSQNVDKKIQLPSDNEFLTPDSNNATEHSNLRTLLEDIYDKQEVNLSDYNVDERIFKGDGWKKGLEWKQVPSFYHAKSVSEDEYTITQISFMDIVVHNSSSYAIQTKIIFGFTIYYEHNNKTLRLYNDNGLVFKDLKLTIESLTDNNVFTSRKVSGMMVGNKSNTIRLWDKLTESPSPEISIDESFPKYYKDQHELYDGMVIKKISADYSPFYLSSTGHYGLLQGTMDIIDDTNTLEFGFTYTAYSHY